eukprot:TRINITY_DN14709_c0_g5_i1.p1 TRINITY_DN14709_c0_g5~~TRINITY_DN14709_c0_g5_i1.p1  ORF type:complete len:109 (-),score=3.64 TRINITY_DN14709_c0_g5_i1:2343-2669(-)
MELVVRYQHRRLWSSFFFSLFHFFLLLKREIIIFKAAQDTHRLLSFDVSGISGFSPFLSYSSSFSNNFFIISNTQYWFQQLKKTLALEAKYRSSITFTLSNISCLKEI